MQSKPIDSTWQLWHERLGHLGWDAVKETSKHVEGMQLKGQKPVGAHCEGCQQGKGHRDPFPTSPSRATMPFQLLHADLFGPVTPQTPVGGRFGSIFRDDYSGAIFVNILSHKSGALTCIKGMISLAERHNHKIKEIRTDNDTVYDSTAAKELYLSHSIHHSKSVPYTPQQNGAAERAVRTLSEAANAILMQAKEDRSASGLSTDLWGEAVLTAAYVRNRTWQKRSGKTPYELLTGKKPDVSHLRVWGSSAYTHIPHQLRQGKFSAHRKVAIFIGYPEDQKAWKFMDQDSKKFFTARDASFFEAARYESQSTQVESVGAFDEDDDDIPSQSASHPSDEAATELPELPEPNPSNYRQSRPIAASPTTIRIPARPNVTPPIFPAGTQVTGQPGWEIRAEPIPFQSHVPRELQFGGATERTAIPEYGGPRTTRSGARFNASIAQADEDLSPSFWAFTIGASSRPDLPASYAAASRSPYTAEWNIACKSEIDSLIKNGTYRACKLPADRTAIDTRWVFALKLDKQGNVERFKARVVARGFKQIEGVDFTDTYSPVAAYSSIRTFLAIAASKDWEIQQIDAITAFLNAPLEEEIYVRAPDGYEEPDGKVWKLEKALYGLKQAGRQWWKMLHAALEEVHLIPAAADPAFG